MKKYHGIFVVRLAELVTDEDRVSEEEPDNDSEGFHSGDSSEELLENDSEVSAGEREQFFIDLQLFTSWVTASTCGSTQSGRGTITRGRNNYP